MSIKIEKGIPYVAGKRGRKSEYPWEEMEVGDSFFAPGLKSPHSQALRASQRYAPAVFKTAPSVVDGVKGARVWRLA